MKNNKFCINLLVLLMALDVTIIVSCYSFASVAFDEHIYMEEFSKYGVYENLKPYDIEKINHDVLDYLSGKENSLLSESNFFNEREKSHFKDVRERIGNLLNLYRTSAIFFLVLLFLLAFCMRFDFKKSLKNLLLALLWGSLLSLAFTVPLFFISNFKFDFLFSELHSTFFHAGTFTFNPEFEKIVVLYPENLFFDILEKIITKIIFSSIITVLVSLFLSKHYFGITFLKKFLEKIRRKNP